MAWLGRAVTAGALPQLESLSLADNPGIGEDGHRYLAAFLRQQRPPPGRPGGCRLKALDLRWTEMGVAGAGALAAAIEAGACPALERLSLAQVGGWGQEKENERGMGMGAHVVILPPPPLSLLSSHMYIHNHQGPLTSWSPEARAALHKVRNALLARSNPNSSSTTTTADAGAADGTAAPPVSAYIARRRAGAARRRAAANGGPRVTCI